MLLCCLDYFLRSSQKGGISVSDPQIVSLVFLLKLALVHIGDQCSAIRVSYLLSCWAVLVHLHLYATNQETGLTSTIILPILRLLGSTSLSAFFTNRDTSWHGSLLVLRHGGDAGVQSSGEGLFQRSVQRLAEDCECSSFVQGTILVDRRLVQVALNNAGIATTMTAGLAFLSGWGS